MALSPAMENLDAICAKFVDEHFHDEDEVRFVLEGAGVFDIRSKDLFGLGVFMLVWAAFVFYAPNFMGHPDNYIPANPLSTPTGPTCTSIHPSSSVVSPGCSPTFTCSALQVMGNSSMMD